ncbi:MAG: DEAD/DEAH box helicase family protein [Rhodospirillales bacterium]|nr:DEAD/DEAH box helicase family protein [Rhodospirillales bacterium]
MARRDAKIEAVGLINVSQRIKEQVLVLEDGPKVVVTARRLCPMPEGIDGVLLFGDDRKVSWLHHKKLTAFDAQKSSKGLTAVKAGICQSWDGQFLFKSEKTDKDGNVLSLGLRPAQLGALHAVGAHWMMSKAPATVVMPTGTGKTETMIASMIAYMPDTLLVTVPWKALREQTAEKFLTLGLLRKLGNISADVRNPIVGIIKHRPKNEIDLDIFKQCNVLIAPMGTMAQGTALDFAFQISDIVSHTIIDEAHHTPAATWSRFKENLGNKPLLQFTATPFRRDGGWWKER